MIILLSGATHTGKTVLAQQLLEKYKYPYLSIDHLKMGLIRSGQTDFTVEDDELLTPYLWSIVREIIKTAIENKQNLIIEGCYIPFDYKKDFDADYLREISYICLVMSEKYINEHFEDIKQHASDIENRLDDSNLSKEKLIRDNMYFYNGCIRHKLDYILIEDEYIPKIIISKAIQG